MHTLTSVESLQLDERAVIEVAAKNRGTLEISSRADTRGQAVRAGRDKLYDPNDPSYAEKCCDAVHRLVEMQLVRGAGGQKHFELTNFGWQLSRKLTLAARAEKA